MYASPFLIVNEWIFNFAECYASTWYLAVDSYWMEWFSGFFVFATSRFTSRRLRRFVSSCVLCFVTLVDVRNDMAFFWEAQTIWENSVLWRDGSCINTRSQQNTALLMSDECWLTWLDDADSSFLASTLRQVGKEMESDGLLRYNWYCFVHFEHPQMHMVAIPATGRLESMSWEGCKM